MFERLGVDAAVLQAADPPPAVVMLDALDGTEITRIPTGESFRRRFKHPYIVIHRVDLHQVLLDACQALRQDRARTGDLPWSGFEDDGDRGPRCAPGTAAASRARP